MTTKQRKEHKIGNQQRKLALLALSAGSDFKSYHATAHMIIQTPKVKK